MLDLEIAVLQSKNCKPTLARRARSAAAIAVLAGVSFCYLGSAPAAARQASWEEECARRVVAPGNGELLREMNCSRQRDCQSLANQQGSKTFGNGCFGVSPSRTATAVND